MKTAYSPDPNRYENATFRHCGNSGLVLPPISLGLWQNFGGADVFDGDEVRIGRRRGLGFGDLLRRGETLE